MRTTLTGKSVGASLNRFPRIKPFTKFGASDTNNARKRRALKTLAADVEEAAAADGIVEALDFEFNFNEAKKNNEYTAADVEAALLFFNKEGPQPECDKDHISNVFGLDEDATYFATIDRLAWNEEDAEEVDEYYFAGIEEAAPEAYENADEGDGDELSMAREAATSQKEATQLLFSMGKEDERQEEDIDLEVDVDNIDGDAEETEDADVDSLVGYQEPGAEAVAAQQWDWLSFLEEAEDDEDDENLRIPPALTVVQSIKASKSAPMDAELELLSLDDENTRDLMQLVNASFVDEAEEAEEGAEEDEEDDLDMDLPDDVMEVLAEFKDVYERSGGDLYDGEDDEIDAELEQAIPTASEAAALDDFVEYFKSDGAMEPAEDVEDDEPEVEEETAQDIWEELAEAAMEMRKRKVIDPEEEDDHDGETWVERVLEVTRVTTVRKGGKVMGFRSVCAVGNGTGRVGVGCASGREIGIAVKRALVDAKKKVIDVPLVGPGTIPHKSEVKFGAARCILIPASDGTGVIAGSSIKSVLELAGVRNVFGKRLGCRSILNNARCTIKALSELKTLNEVSRARGIPMDELLVPKKR